ncbi:hypothetical protein T05_14224 [Trichinella murrelli]|uniref:Uncharacterized protein n=1 Tax=Trichinella murrelli TaxID=144512 RepID=A0A0V0U558_9BILA|nr:hypothetical protein T05_14224 [Trichinella murrelli]
MRSIDSVWRILCAFPTFASSSYHVNHFSIFTCVMDSDRMTRHFTGKEKYWMQRCGKKIYKFYSILVDGDKVLWRKISIRCGARCCWWQSVTNENCTSFCKFFCCSTFASASFNKQSVSSGELAENVNEIDFHFVIVYSVLISINCNGIENLGKR